MAIVIQAKFKAYIHRKKIKRYLALRNYAAHKITSLSKKFMARKKFQQHKAAIKIQLLFRKNSAIQKKT